MLDSKTSEKKISWSYEFKLTTRDIVTAVVLGVASSVIIYFIELFSMFWYTLGPWGAVLGWPITSGFYLTTFVIAAYLQKRAAVAGFAMAIQFIGRLMIGGGADPSWFAYWATFTIPFLLVLHYGQYKSKAVYVAAAAVGSTVWNLSNLFLFAYYLLPPEWWVTGHFVISPLVGAFEAGVLGILISDGLVKAGIVKRVQ
jgi:hypothetical protein